MKRVTIVAAIAWVCSTTCGWAQTTSNENFVDRPATTSAVGDTGIWFVPTGETLPTRKWSASVSRTESKFDEGFTDVGMFPVSAAYGVGRSVEVFGSVRAITRIDRDTRPLFSPSTNEVPAGIVNEFPATRQGWSGNQFGDTWLGGKVSLLSQQRRQPLALAVRGMVKLPTADKTQGAGTGKTDWSLDGIVSKELKRRVELTGYTGFTWRGDPNGIRLSDGVQWGIGGGFPSRTRVRLTAELYGEHLLDDRLVAVPGVFVAADGTTSPALSNIDDPLNVAVGVTLQTARGLLLSAGLVSALHVHNRVEFGSQFRDNVSNSLIMQFRIGFHSGVLTYVPPPPAIAQAPPAPAPVAAPPPPRNGSPTVRAQCDPCDVETGRAASIRAVGSDPDGDPVEFRWTTASGSIADPSMPATTWRAPTEPGPVTLTVTVADGKGGTATDTVTIDVRERAVATSGTPTSFEDVQFAFDRYSLDSTARATLDAAATALKKDPTIQLEIEGHTCNLGSAAYNLALGARRAAAVRDYLIMRGISPQRMTTVSYGERRPKFDNDTRASRSKNRRAVLTVRVQQ
jgi:outer membrane protein OmpA-like peptidoglycan-associated protein